MTTEIKLTEAELKNLESIDLLDIEMESIPDAPEFRAVPTGIYSVELMIKSASYDRKLYDEKGVETGETIEDIRIGVNAKLVEVLELSSDTDNEPNAGDMFGSSYFGKRGVQQVSGLLKEVAKHLGVKTVGAVLESFASGVAMPCVVAVTHRSSVSKKDGKTYENNDYVSIEPNVQS